MKRIFIRKQR